MTIGEALRLSGYERLMLVDELSERVPEPPFLRWRDGIPPDTEALRAAIRAWDRALWPEGPDGNAATTRSYER